MFHTRHDDREIDVNALSMGVHIDFPALLLYYFWGCINYIAKYEIANFLKRGTIFGGASFLVFGFIRLQRLSLNITAHFM
jgi:hypothetical protein